MNVVVKPGDTYPNPRKWRDGWVIYGIERNIQDDSELVETAERDLPDDTRRDD
jgi:hypothetical protein